MNAIIENKDIPKEDRHNLVSVSIHHVASFCDEHQLYLNDEITVHCVSLLMGFEDIPEIKDEKQRQESIKQFRNSLIAAKGMIRKEAGVADLDRLFRSIIKPRHSSLIIEYYRKLKKKQGVQGIWK